MKLMAKIFSGAGLILTVGPPVVVFQGAMDLGSAKLFMLAGAVIWFSTAPVWMNAVTTEEER